MTRGVERTTGFLREYLMPVITVNVERRLQTVKKESQNKKMELNLGIIYFLLQALSVLVYEHLMELPDKSGNSL